MRNHQKELRALTVDLRNVVGLLDEVTGGTKVVYMTDIIRKLLAALEMLIGRMLTLLGCLQMEGTLEELDELINSPTLEEGQRQRLKALGEQLWEVHTRLC